MSIVTTIILLVITLVIVTPLTLMFVAIDKINYIIQLCEIATKEERGS